MPTVVREDINPLNAILTVKIEKTDYETDFKSELKNYQKKAQLKGFRRGKTPLSVIKKMFGKSILGELINKQIESNLFKYIEDEKLPVLGNPLSADGQEQLDLNIKSLEDYEFKFEVGLAPDFELKGLDDNLSIDYYVTNVEEEKAKEQLETARKQLGERIQVTENIGLEDMVKFAVKELDGGSPKEDGVTSEFSILVKDVQDDAIKADLQTRKVGDVFTVEVFKLEPEHIVRKHLLQIEEDTEVGELFEATVLEANRQETAELNEAFFQKYFGEDTEISTKEEAVAEIQKLMAQSYEQPADTMMFNDVMELLLAQNEFELPGDFLKKWMLRDKEESATVTDTEFESFAKSLRYNLIRDKIVARYDIQVAEEDIKASAKAEFAQYLGGYGSVDWITDEMIGRLLSDQEQVNKHYNSVLTSRIKDKFKETIKLIERTVTEKEFEEVVKAYNEKVNPQPKEPQATVTATSEEGE